LSRYSGASTYNNHINLYDFNSNKRRIIEIELNMEIKKALNGYFFYLFPIYDNDCKNIVHYNAEEIPEINGRKKSKNENNKYSTRSKKYKFLFKTLKPEEEGKKSSRDKNYSISINPKHINEIKSKKENKEIKLSNISKKREEEV